MAVPDYPYSNLTGRSFAIRNILTLVVGSTHLPVRTLRYERCGAKGSDTAPPRDSMMKVWSKRLQGREKGCKVAPPRDRADVHAVGPLREGESVPRDSAELVYKIGLVAS